ncbi:trypsin-like peptidase domain-containing protein [Streptomyces sp. NPDC005840]|uniref:trypsin-like peptidase domain-containing protein n=1 Tax=unclassified Streptomyces TaxID=2593676 RepID=UPI00331EB9EA
MGTRNAAASVPPGAATWRARIHGRDGGGVAGAGLLLTDRTVLTCAHVVEAALGRTEADRVPEGTLRVGFPAAGTGGEVTARVAADGWLRLPPALDLAVLRLAEPPPGSVTAAPVGTGGAATGTPVTLFGHPASVPHGLWASGRVTGPGGAHPRWRQIDGLDLVGAAVERGFSGAGVWDLDRGLVIGVLATVLLGRRSGQADGPRVSWMIPLDVLDPALLPPAAAPARSAEPADGWTAPPSALWPLVDRLLAMESFRLDAGPLLLGQLPAEVAAGVTRSAHPRVQLYHLVGRCGEFAQGPAALVRAVRWLEGDTRAVTEFVAQARETWPDRLADDD